MEPWTLDKYHWVASRCYKYPLWILIMEKGKVMVVGNIVMVVGNIQAKPVAVSNSHLIVVLFNIINVDLYLQDHRNWWGVGVERLYPDFFQRLLN